ncbi:MAG: HEPN domain-containing protein [Fervidicoccaceae archaeon]
MTKRDEVNTLLERSRRFYEFALFQIEKGFYDLAMFSFEQSLQLLLKAAPLSLSVDYLRTHSVRRLLELVHELTGSEGVKKLLVEYSVELALLEDAYITSRYVPRDFRAEEVLRVKEAVDRVFRVVREALSKTSQAQS